MTLPPTQAPEDSRTQTATGPQTETQIRQHIEPEQEITQAALGVLVRRFYGKVRQDALIGPVFERAVEDWEEHFHLLTAFWSAVMLGIPGFKGHPMGAHLRLGDEITPPMFERWLALWRETTAECFAPEPAADLQARAAQIGRNFQLALFGPSYAS